MVRLLRQIWLNFKEYIVLALLLIISLLIVSLNENKQVKSFRTFVFSTFAAPTAFFSDALSVSDLKSENLKLRLENAELMLEVNKLREYGIQNEELKFLLRFRDTSGYTLIPAGVIAKTPENFQSIININVGSSEGVVMGMPVITDLGLVGFTSNVTDNFSTVKTLKNSSVRIIVKNQRSRVEGILKWDGKNLLFTNIPKTADVKPGDRIISSELSSLLPTQLPIGIVTKLENPDSGILNEYSIKPFAEITKTDYIFILKQVSGKKSNGLELNYFNLRQQ